MGMRHLWVMMMNKDNLGNFFFNTKCRFRGLNKVFRLIFFWNFKTAPSEKARGQPGKYRPVRFSLLPGNVMQCILSEHISGCRKEKKVTGSSQHGFKKSQSCLASLISNYDCVAGQWQSSRYHFHWVYQGIQGFFPHILVFKLGCYSRNGGKSGGL